MAGFSDFEVVGVKHVRRRGQSVTPMSNIDRATESHFLAQAIADVDGHRFGMTILALPATATIPPAVVLALQGEAQRWVDDNPDGDPGDDPNRGSD